MTSWLGEDVCGALMGSLWLAELLNTLIFPVSTWPCDVTRWLPAPMQNTLSKLMWSRSKWEPYGSFPFTLIL